MITDVHRLKIDGTLRMKSTKHPKHLCKENDILFKQLESAWIINCEQKSVYKGIEFNI